MHKCSILAVSPHILSLLFSTKTGEACLGTPGYFQVVYSQPRGSHRLSSDGIKTLSTSSLFIVSSSRREKGVEDLTNDTTGVTEMDEPRDGSGWMGPHTSTLERGIPSSSSVSRRAVSVADASLSSVMPPGKLTSPACLERFLDLSVSSTAGSPSWLKQKGTSTAAVRLLGTLRKRRPYSWDDGTKVSMQALLRSSEKNVMSRLVPLLRRTFVSLVSPLRDQARKLALCF